MGEVTNHFKVSFRLYRAVKSGLFWLIANAWYGALREKDRVKAISRPSCPNPPSPPPVYSDGE